MRCDHLDRGGSKFGWLRVGLMRSCGSADWRGWSQLAFLRLREAEPRLESCLTQRKLLKMDSFGRMCWTLLLNITASEESRVKLFAELLTRPVFLSKSLAHFAAFFSCSWIKVGLMVPHYCTSFFIKFKAIFKPVRIRGTWSLRGVEKKLVLC